MGTEEQTQNEWISPCADHPTAPCEFLGFACACPASYSGTYCEVKSFTNCVSPTWSECLSRGICIDGPTDFTCNCLPGWTNSTCQTNVDECASNPCQNGGECIEDEAYEKMIYTCACADGFGGDNCELKLTCDPDAGDVCSPDLCDPAAGDPCCTATGNPCLHGATCSEGEAGAVLCDCLPGWEGDNCEINIDECDGSGGPSDLCTGGLCSDIINGYVCTCPSGWQPGPTNECPVEQEECASNPCLNGGSSLRAHWHW